MEPSSASGSPVVARFLDGRVVKGSTQDFGPNKPNFHLHVWGEAGARGLAVPVGALKALFFVKTFEGDKRHVEDVDVAHASGPGRRIVVTFGDGEVVSGVTTGYSPDKQGFFVIPTDPKSNNGRIYVVTAAVKKIEFGGVPAATASSGAR